MELLRDVPISQYQESPMSMACLHLSPLVDMKETTEVRPLFSRQISEIVEEEEASPVSMNITKMEEVGVFSESVNR